METLEKLQQKIPKILLKIFPKIINYEPFKNLGKKIEELKYFSEVTFKILEIFRGNISIGMTEREIDAKIRKAARKYNLIAFPLLVSSGENTAKVHGYSTDRKITESDILMIDMGLKRHLFSNCTSDITRTIFLGEPTDFQQKIYNIVKKAHDMAIKAVKPGINAFRIDKLVRNYFKKYNYEMPHGLGHGTGTRYPHNIPMLTNKFTDFILKESDIITIEPGIYLPGQFGVRIEDMVLVKKDGNEILSQEGRSNP